jgi:hypothetical protein
MSPEQRQPTPGLGTEQVEPMRAVWPCIGRGVVTPSRTPLSTSSRLPPPVVWLVQPIFGAIDSIAAHCDGYSSRCSRTMRAATKPGAVHISFCYQRGPSFILDVCVSGKHTSCIWNTFQETSYGRRGHVFVRAGYRQVFPSLHEQSTRGKRALSDIADERAHRRGSSTET